MIPEVKRTMKAILDGVMSWAARMRSPSFSREGESRTTRKLPWEKEWMQSGIGSKRLVVEDAIEGGICVFGRLGRSIC